MNQKLNRIVSEIIVKKGSVFLMDNHEQVLMILSEFLKREGHETAIDFNNLSIKTENFEVRIPTRSYRELNFNILK